MTDSPPFFSVVGACTQLSNTHLGPVGDVLQPSSGRTSSFPGSGNNSFSDGAYRKGASFEVAEPCELSGLQFGGDVIKLSERRQSCD